MKIYIDVFILGISLSWGPCLSFCAPILLPYIGATQKGWPGGLKLSLAFSFARVIVYCFLSLVSATLGYLIIRRFYETKAELIIYIVAGAFIALLGILIVMGKSLPQRWCPPLKKVAVREREATSAREKEASPARKGGVKEMFFLGFLIGFAPCAPLFGLLLYIAFNAQNFLHGAILGLVFGLGTLISPLILLGPLTAQAASLFRKKPLAYKIFSRACGVILVYFGISMVIRASAAIGWR